VRVFSSPSPSSSLSSLLRECIISTLPSPIHSAHPSQQAIPQAIITNSTTMSHAMRILASWSLWWMISAGGTRAQTATTTMGFSTAHANLNTVIPDMTNPPPQLASRDQHSHLRGRQRQFSINNPLVSEQNNQRLPKWSFSIGKRPFSTPLFWYHSHSGTTASHHQWRRCGYVTVSLLCLDVRTRHVWYVRVCRENIPLSCFGCR
jgi:hypothetical protein